jgi:hypothetical protein
MRPMADQPVTVRRERMGQTIGRIDDRDIARLNAAVTAS